MIWFFIVAIILVILIGISFYNENSDAQRITIGILFITAIVMFSSYSFTGFIVPKEYAQQKIPVESEEGITKEIDVYEDSDGNYYLKEIDKTKYWLIPFYTPEFVKVSLSDLKKSL